MHPPTRSVSSLPNSSGRDNLTVFRDCMKLSGGASDFKTLKVTCVHIKKKQQHFRAHILLVDCNLVQALKKSGELLWWHSGQKSTCQCRGHGFNPWSGKIPHAAEKLSPCVTTTEPALQGPRSCSYLSPCFLEATAMRSPHNTMKSSPCSPQLEKACTKQ